MQYLIIVEFTKFHFVQCSVLNFIIKQSDIFENSYLYRDNRLIEGGGNRHSIKKTCLLMVVDVIIRINVAQNGITMNVNTLLFLKVLYGPR